MIGAKTLVTVTLFTIGLAAACAFGVLAPERLASRGWGTLFLIGAVGIVVGTVLFRFWRLGERSQHYFRFTRETNRWSSADESHFLGTDRWRMALGDNRGEAFELGPRTHHALCVAIGLLLALACLDARAVGLLDQFEHGLTAATSSFCPEPEADKPEGADPNAPGCELIRRAHALGYADDLGDCETHKKRVAARTVCTRRQRDEPFFHYAWRLLEGSWNNLRKHTESSYFSGVRRDFDQRIDRLGALRRSQRQILSSAPHASHHLWTNLPDPNDGAFREQTCADRYRWLAHRPAPSAGDKQASKVFEHVVAQLLFESRYEPAAAYCRELHVHWDAPADSCQRLAANPTAVLAASGALSDVQAVLDRYQLGQELAAPGTPRQRLDPASFVSFQCYFEGGAADRKSTPFSFAGHDFTTEEIRVPPTASGSGLYTDRYDAVAKLLIRGFHYGALLSEAGVEPGAADGLQAAFAGHDYLLTRVYGLDSLDIYLDPGFIAERPDLLEVYPYQRHLRNYVQIFRRQYRRERSRL